MRLQKDQHEEFARFFSEPTRDAFRQLVRNSVGEADHLDFKEAWPDTPKLAKHVLSLANSGGGALVIGVRQDPGGQLEASGLSSILDKAQVTTSLKRFLPKSLNYFVIDFTYTSSDFAELAGRSFQVVLVECDPKELPYLTLSDGNDLRRNAIYVRSGTSSREADHDELQQLLNRRVETGHSSQGALDLTKHIEQLRILDELRHHNDSWMSRIIREHDNPADDTESSDFKGFIEGIYERKKAQIFTELGLGRFDPEIDWSL